MGDVDEGELTHPSKLCVNTVAGLASTTACMFAPAGNWCVSFRRTYAGEAKLPQLRFLLKYVVGGF
jgi:hypothetical protein